MKKIDWVAISLLLVGGINWGLIAINPSWNLVNMALGSMPMVERIVYGLVGISAVYSVYSLFGKK